MNNSNKKKQPLVSVVLSVYNAEIFLEEAIKSIEQQTYPNIEVIAINDGSTDKSLEILQRHPEIINFSRSEKGESQTRNEGIMRATGTYISFLDPDDIFLPEKISSQVKYLESHPSIPMCVPLCKGFLESGLQKPSWVRSGIINTSHKNLSPSAWLIRKQFFDDIGLIDTHLNSGCDFEWIQRVKKCGYKIGLIRRVLWKKRIHNTAASAFVNSEKIRPYYRELLTILKKKV